MAGRDVASVSIVRRDGWPDVRGQCTPTGMLPMDTWNFGLLVHRLPAACSVYIHPTLPQPTDPHDDRL